MDDQLSYLVISCSDRLYKELIEVDIDLIEGRVIIEYQSNKKRCCQDTDKGSISCLGICHGF